MVAPSKNFTVIPDSSVDADSPGTVPLMTQIRDSLIHLEEWLGGGFVAAIDHDHNGVNSKLVDAGIVPLGSAVAANSAVIDFNGLDTTYDHHILEVINLLPVTNAVDAYLRLSDDNGATFKAGAADYRRGSHNSTFTTDNKINASSSGGPDNLSNVAGDYYNAIIHIWNAGVVGKTHITILPMYRRDNGNVDLLLRGGRYDTAAITDAVRFFLSSGNIAEGNFNLYGVRKV